MALPRADIAVAAILTAVLAVTTCALADLPTWPALVVQLLVLAGAWPDRDGHHGRGVGLANAITLFRSLLVGLLAAWVAALPDHRTAVVLVAGLAFALDGVDGAVARRTARSSRLGARLDMELDAVTVAVLSLLCWRLDLAGPWVLIAGGWRYAFAAAARLAPWMRAPLDDFRPRRWACAAGVSGLIAALALSPPSATVTAAAAVAAISGSFLRDIGWLWRTRLDAHGAGPDRLDVDPAAHVDADADVDFASVAPS